MALVAETGAGVDGANSYCATADASAFFTDRSLAVPTDGQLLQAMDTIESLLFDGTKTISDSALSFPRTGITDRYGVPYSENYIPPELIQAQLWLAHYISTGADPSAAVTPQVKSEKVDVLEVEYFGEDSGTTRLSFSDLPNFYNSIRHLLGTGALSSSASGGRVIRA